MSEKVLQGGKFLIEEINKIAESMAKGTVSVGFMSGATYPDGESVAEVAFTNEFGDPSNNQPPRPFFRRMIAKESPAWGDKIARLLRGTNYDGKRTLELMGEDIKGGLIQSINEFESPKLAPYTIKKKGFAKPLIDTGQMVNSITAKVDD